MYAVVVTFQIVPGKMGAFLPLMRENAATSQRQEDGCHRFDICTDPAHPNEVFLYELYSNRAAFDLHLTSDHFKEFDTQTTQMIAAKSVRTFQDVTT
ncbi:quinol monooxygenase YgiN [Yoonia maricola]|uniref:Quinol monooxygenase YgiN n=1 Tax=Yoonia maricola TaxID=420999 RepID=A0A2M8W4C5_9RHOB|nr:putative quinol monooxygenase [Yoonia maricola]PJI85773.1 quinol monooxygenase YgiN [Yoonia maricola]